MICNNCGKEFEGKFCPYCGTKAREEMNDCPVCGKERLEESRFCANCGYDFESVGAGEAEQSDNAGESKAQVAQPVDKERKSVKALPIIAKVYRWLIAGGMLFLGVVAMLCLTAPIGVESFLGMSNPLCSGFVAIGGGDGAPTSVVNASIMLLIVSILALVYGGLQLFFAIKRPYKSVKKIHFWAIDGVICLIVLILGFVVAGAVNSEQLMDAKLGAGFAMCIVMGIVGLLCLGARIFYELKLFKWEDTGLSEEQIAKAQEKKERQPIDKAKLKKIALRVGIPVLVVAVLIAIIIPSVAWANNIFRVGKVDKVNIGDTQEQVVKVLGEPYVKNNYYYEYYSENYTKLVDQVEALSNNLENVLGNMDRLNTLYEQLNNTVYKYIRVDFDSDKKVSEVFFDNDKCDTYSAEESNKEVKSCELVTKEILRYSATDIAYSIKFTDGSFYKAIAIKNYITFTTSFSETIKWSDNWKSDYSEKINVKDNPDIQYASYLSDEKSVYCELDKNNVLKIKGTGDITKSISLSSKYIVEEINIGSNISNIGLGYFESIISSVMKIAVDENNATYKSEANCVIEKTTNTLVLGCKGSTISSSVESIGDYAFRGCNSLTSIEIPSSVAIIGEVAFSGCSNLTIYCQVSSQPSGWSSYWNWEARPVVWDCKEYGQTESGIKWGLANSGIMTIAGYSGESKEIEIPSTINAYSVTNIVDCAFIQCSNLTSVTFAEGSQLTSIGSYAFYNCSSLTSITIPSSVTSIGDRAFNGCISLTSIAIPSSVTSIGEYAFYGCISLTIYCEASSAPSGLSDSGYTYYDNRYGNCHISVILECKEHGITDNGIKWGLTNSGIMTIAGYIGESTEIEIPSTINGFNVASIADYAFYYCSSLTSVTIPNSVISIGDQAFYCCRNLTSVTFESGSQLTSIADYAFYYCSSLTSVTFASGSQLTSIGNYAFYECSGLTSIEIPSSVTSIGNYAFYNCISLTSVTIPSSVTSIGDYAFCFCSSLTSVMFESGSQLTSIGDSAFYSCSSLTSIAIPSSVTSIGSDAFWHCSSLTSVTFASGSQLTSIGSDAFAYCSSLTSVTIPSSVTSIGSDAFWNCSSLTIYCEASSQPSGWDSSWNYNNRPVVWGIKDYGITDSGIQWILTNGKTVRIVGYGGTSTQVEIPSTINGYNVTSIGDGAFSGSRSLTSIEIPSSVTSIGSNAFYNCISLRRVTFASGSQLTSIGSYAFNNCSSLTSITIPSGVTSIGSYAFAGCSSLTIYCEASSRPSGWSSSWNYSNRPVVLGIKNYGITDSGIQWILTNGSTVTIVGYGGTSTQVEIPLTINGYTVTSIGSYAFYSCSNLTSVTFASGSQLMSIGSYAFYSCSNLTSITIPSSVTSIGFEAFNGCESLTSVTFENTSGWYRSKSSSATSGTNIDVTDPSTNATNLKSTYYNYYWKRNA